MIVIISYPEDKHYLAVKQKLDAMKKKNILIDFNSYPTKLNASFEISPYSSNVLFSAGSRSIHQGEIQSVWYRRIHSPHKETDNSQINRYISNETKQFLDSLPLLCPEINWVSNPINSRTAAHKPFQLKLAAYLGMNIPDTVIGNHQETVLQLLNKHPDGVIVKPVDMSFVKFNNKKGGLLIYTKKIPNDSIRKNLARISNCPIIVQEVIRKIFDVRVTVIGSHVFAASIHSNCQNDQIDWRHPDANAKYKNHQLPLQLAEKCLQLTHNLGLRFGCLDFGYSEDKGYVFFEINPGGQWLPTEVYTGQNLSQAMADILCENTNKMEH